MDVLLVLAVFILGCFFAGLVYWGALNYTDWSAKRTSITCAGFVFVSAALGLFAWSASSHLRRITLYEAVVELAESTQVSAAFSIESPGVEHTLRLAPKTRILRQATATLKARVRMDCGGHEQVLDEVSVFEIETRSSIGRSPGSKSEHDVWASNAWAFTPPRASVCNLDIQFVNGRPPKLLIRVEDPTKQDGQRAQ